MNIQQWQEWKNKQPYPTCDYLGCYSQAFWLIKQFYPNQNIYFCAEHGKSEERLLNDYGVMPQIIHYSGVKK